jgi:hypothetical protein
MVRLFQLQPATAGRDDSLSRLLLLGSARTEKPASVLTEYVTNGNLF